MCHFDEKTQTLGKTRGIRGGCLEQDPILTEDQLSRC
jgi:hypothetical protein